MTTSCHLLCDTGIGEVSGGGQTLDLGQYLPCYCLNCTKFGKLILGKTIKIVATRCHFLKLKCTKFDFGWDPAPDPTGGTFSAPPDPLPGFKWSDF